MRRLITFSFIGVLIFSGCRETNHKQAETFASDRIIVKYKTSATQTSIDSLKTELGLLQVKEIPELGVTVYRLSSGMNIDEAVQKCKSKPFVKYAEPDYQVRAIEEKKSPK